MPSEPPAALHVPPAPLQLTSVRVCSINAASFNYAHSQVPAVPALDISALPPPPLTQSILMARIPASEGRDSFFRTGSIIPPPPPEEEDDEDEEEEEKEVEAYLQAHMQRPKSPPAGARRGNVYSVR